MCEGLDNQLRSMLVATPEVNLSCSSPAAMTWHCMFCLKFLGRRFKAFFNQADVRLWVCFPGHAFGACIMSMGWYIVQKCHLTWLKQVCAGWRSDAEKKYDYYYSAPHFSSLPSCNDNGFCQPLR